MKNKRRKTSLLFEGADWDFDTLARIYDGVAAIGYGEMKLDIYRPRIEVITTEQMLDAYASTGMPLFYRHWSFGKQFVRNESPLPQGLAGPSLRDRHQLEPLRRLSARRKLRHDADARAGARRVRP